MEMGTEYNVDATSAVKEGKTVNEFRAEVLGTVSSRMKEVEMKRNSPIESAEIGMTDAEVSNFSFTRAINALANPTDRQAQEAASFEFEASRAASDRAGVTPQGLFVPVDVMTRDLNTTSGSAVIGDTLAGSSFIEMLDSYMVTSSAGATIMRDLNGNISIPRQTSGATSYWVTDGTPDVTESEATFDQVPLSAKTIGALTDIGRRLLSQSSVDIEGLIRKDLAQRLALGIDAKALETIAAATGIGVVTLGGGAPTFEEIVALETAVATDNALVGNLAYVAPAGVVGGLKTTSTEAGSGRFILENGQANGYGVYTSNNTSETIFGNFADLIMGYWGGLDINVDTATNSKSGAVRVVALQDVDFGIRHGESFAKTA
jgi:HK97 family phage major capsid protein